MNSNDGERRVDGPLATREERSPRRFDRFVQIVGVVIAVIAVIVTVVFSLRSERTKELTVTFAPPRPLVSADGIRANSGLEVRFGATILTKPWLVSATLENTGNQPIEARDIETPLKLHFQHGRIISAEIVDRNRPEIFARPSATDDSVSVEHRLLNPGDRISFDVLFDGEPNVPPIATFRISGVSAPIVGSLLLGERRSYLTLFPVPTPVFVLIAVSAVLASLFALIFGLVLLGTYFGRLAGFGFKSVDSFDFRQSLFSDGDWRASPRIRRLLSRSVPQTPSLRAVHAFVSNTLKIEQLDAPSDLRAVVAEHVPADMLRAIGMTVDEAAIALRKEVGNALQNEMAEQAYADLPIGPDSRAREAIRKLDPNLPFEEFFRRAKDIVSADKASVVPNPDSAMLFVGAILSAIAIAIILIVGGSWRTYLGW